MIQFYILLLSPFKPDISSEPEKSAIVEAMFEARALSLADTVSIGTDQNYLLPQYLSSGIVRIVLQSFTVKVLGSLEGILTVNNSKPPKICEQPNTDTLSGTQTSVVPIIHRLG